MFFFMEVNKIKFTRAPCSFMVFRAQNNPDKACVHGLRHGVQHLQYCCTCSVAGAYGLATVLSTAVTALMCTGVGSC